MSIKIDVTTKANEVAFNEKFVDLFSWVTFVTLNCFKGRGSVLSLLDFFFWTIYDIYILFRTHTYFFVIVGGGLVVPPAGHVVIFRCYLWRVVVFFFFFFVGFALSPTFQCAEPLLVIYVWCCLFLFYLDIVYYWVMIFLWIPWYLQPLYLYIYIYAY